MTLQESGKALDALVNNVLANKFDKPNAKYMAEGLKCDIKDMAEGLKCDIDVTKDFFNIIMHNYESTNPKECELRRLYFDTQTYGFVMFDRLESLAQQIDELVNVMVQQH